MKQLTCEMCGSTELIKNEGVFVCQSCGTKYSVEEAKKMMVEGTVTISGAVKVDDSAQLNNLLVLAKQAVENTNGDECIRYGDEILKLDISNWYGWYTKAVGYENKATVGEPFTEEFISAVNNALERTDNDEDKVLILSHALSKISSMVTSCDALLEKNLQNLRMGISDLETTLMIASLYGFAQTTRTKIRFGDLLSLDETIAKKAAELYYQIIYKYREDEDAESQKDTIAAYAKGVPQHLLMEANEKLKRVKQSEPPKSTVQTTQQTSTGSCYVATAVYGCYDCPQVWTLRRYRDDTLSSSWYGRAFIRTYYTISPTIVKMFGKTTWFNTFFRKRLDMFAAQLNANGVSDTPYCDRDGDNK